MGLLPPDFESGAYTNFATQARTMNIKLFLARSQMRGYFLPTKTHFF